MDTQRCQNHGPVRVLVPLLEFNRNRHDEIWRVRFSRSLQREEATLLSGQRLEMALDD